MSEKKQLFSSLGAVGTAILASSCCWLPLLLIVLGVGSATMSSVVGVLEDFRPLFILGAVAMLGVAFYLTYRKRKGAVQTDGTCSTDQEASCCPSEQEQSKQSEDCCPSSVSRIQKINRIMLLFLSVFVLAMVIFPEAILVTVLPAEAGNSGPSVVAAENEEEIYLAIEGMT